MDKYGKAMKRVFLLVLTLAGSMTFGWTQNTLFLLAGSTEAQCGDTIEIPVRVVDFDQVVALDFSMVWDPGILEFTGQIGNLNAAIGLTPFNFGPYQTPDNDTLTFQWFNALGASLPDSATLFTLQYVVRGNGGLLGPVLFGNQYTPIACGKIINGSIDEVPVDTLHGAVVIEDNLDPSVTCPDDTIVSIPSGANGIIVHNLDPTTSDNCAVDSLLYTLTGATAGMGVGSASGQFFLAGNTTVSYTVKDFAGNEADCSFEVSVQDTFLRLFVILPDSVLCDDESFRVDITAQNFFSIASLQFGLSWNGVVFPFDSLGNFHPALNLNLGNFGPIAGIDDTLTFSWFNPLGVTLPDNAVLFSMYFSVNGQAGSSHIIQFGNMPSVPIEASMAQPFPNLPVKIDVQTFNASVFIYDLEAPVIQCPDDVTVDLPSGQPSVTVNGIDPVMADNCGIEELQYELTGATSGAGSGSASGQSFQQGNTTVQYTVTDFGGNEATCSFQVIVADSILRLFVIMPDSISCEDTFLKVDITAQNFNSIASLQFGLSWNGVIFPFDSLGNFHPALNLSLANFGPISGIDDTLTFSWFNPLGVTLPDNEVLFSLYFSVTGLAGTSHTIQFGNMPSVPIEASMAQPFPNLPVIIGVETFDASLVIYDLVTPQVECPDDLTVQIPQLQTSQVVNGIDPVASDNCEIESVEYSLSGATQGSGPGSASGQTFQLGTTTVQYLVTDYGGNTASCSFSVTLVEDTLTIIVMDPEVLCTDTIVEVCVKAEAFNHLASLQFAMTWDGKIIEYVSISQTNPALNLSGTNFGPTSGIEDTLTFSWFNAAGVTIPDDSILFCVLFDLVGGVNTSTDLLLIDHPSVPIEASVAQPLPQFPVVVPVDTVNGFLEVSDDEPPVITNCPSDQTVEAAPAFCQAVAHWTALVATDNCTPDVMITCSHTSGDIFDLGTTQVLCVATDEAGLTDTCVFQVTVVDTQDPILICEQTDIILVSAADSCGVTAYWELPEAIDNCPSGLTLDGPVPGIFLEVGEHTITYVATDGSGNSASCSFSIFVLDETPPVPVTCPNDLTVEATTDSCTAIITPPVPVFTDNCGDLADLTFKIGIEFDTAGASVELPLGTTTIVWYAFDFQANLDSCVYTITVEGGGDYILTCPGDLLITLDETDCDTILSWELPTWEGGCGGNEMLDLVGNFNPGDSFDAGTHNVVYHLLHPVSGDTLATCGFTVTVLEVTPPVFVDCPSSLFFVADSDSCTADVQWTPPIAVDNCTDSLSITYTSSGPTPGIFAIGTYTVSYTATDASGNTAFCEFVISVCDTVAPLVVSCPTDTTFILPNDTSLCEVIYEWETDPAFTDNCTAQLEITSNRGPGLFLTGSTDVVYTATDECGNVAVCSFTVTVLEAIDPVALCPGDVTIRSDGTIVSDPDGFLDSLVVTECREVEVYFNLPTGTDNCGIAGTTQIDLTGLGNGDVFPAGGPYTLIFEIIDRSGNTDTCIVNVTVLPYPLAVTADPNPACLGDDVILMTESFPNGSYSWTGPDGFVSTDESPVVPAITASGQGSYSVSVIPANCTNTLTGSVNVNVLVDPLLFADSFTVYNDTFIMGGNLILNDQLNPSANADITFITQPGSGTLTNNFNGTFDYTPAPDFVGTVEFVYRICYQECPNACDTALVRITVEIRDESCKPNNLITPNNDDRNDVVVFKCIIGTPPKFPNNTLTIYNQWGDQVFYASPYENNWGGTYQGNASAPLPDGTYYYVFTKGDGSDPITGFITIFR